MLAWILLIKETLHNLSVWCGYWHASSRRWVVLERQISTNLNKRYGLSIQIKSQTATNMSLFMWCCNLQKFICFLHIWLYLVYWQIWSVSSFPIWSVIQCSTDRSTKVLSIHMKYEIEYWQYFSSKSSSQKSNLTYFARFLHFKNQEAANL